MTSAAVADNLIPPSASWRYFKGIQEASPADISSWRQLTFSDANWAVGVEPFFYGETLTGTTLVDMQGAYSSVYFRKTFDVANPADLKTVALKVRSDDGFVAWINGIEIARYNVPAGDLRYDATSLTTVTEPIPLDEYPVNPTLLRPGQNVLAIHGLNGSISGSSDFVLDAWLEFTGDTAPPVIERIIPPANAVVSDLPSIEIQFSEAVSGLEAADLLINSQAATNVVEFAPGQFVFTFPRPANGIVTVSFAANHGITDRASNPHPFAGGSWSLTVNPDGALPDLLINEFMTDNDRTLRDEDGDKSDWIELLNAGADNVSLAGWSLTDDPAVKQKWKLPAVNLAPNNFLLIYASAKNKTNSALPLHTNFKLSSGAGGFLALANAAGEFVSVFTNYPAQRTDVSYGRAAGAPAQVGYFVQPTPGAVNSQRGDGFAPAVIFSESSRTYLSSITVELTTTNSNAVIRYTMDGTVPSETSPAYVQPFVLTNTMQIRARAFVDGLLPGPTRSETFIPLANPVAAFTSDLPVLLIHDFGRGRPSPSVDVFAHVQLFEPGTNGVTSLTNLPTLTSRATISSRGSSTEGYAKVSLKLDFQQEVAVNRDVPLLGMPEESDWVLYAPNNFEPILIHNPFAHQLSRDIGRYSPRTRFVEIYLVTSGTGVVAQTSYNGIYVLEEKVKFGKDRVDVPKLQPGQNSPPALTGGYLMKIDRADPGDAGFSTPRQAVRYVDPKEPEIKQASRAGQRAYITSHMTAFEAALYGANYRNPTNGYRAYVDVDSWIDHHLLNVLTFNVDALRLSAFFYKEREGKLHFGPLWDFDRALNSTDGRDSNPRVWRSRSGDLGTDFFNYPWWARLFLDPDFYQQYIDRYQELRRAQFSTTNLWRLVDALTDQVRKAQPREQARWNVTPRGGYQGEINSLKTWLSNRVDFMDSQFVRPPSFAIPGQVLPSGSQLEINVPANTVVYYTLDGTDPRLLGSTTGTNVSPQAIAYTGPITVTRNVRVFARAQNLSHTALTGANNPPLKSTWSGPIVDTYVVNPFPIVVTEIMYHPMGDGANTSFDSEDFEFIELKNVSQSAIDLRGFQLHGTIDFSFSETNEVQSIGPGGYLLLVGNLKAFQTRYPTVTNVAGQFTGKLNNDGGRLRLTGPLLEPVFDFSYSDAWQTKTDGDGFSLTLQDETAPSPARLGVAESWRPSASIVGSPGKADGASGIGLRLTASASNGAVLIRFAGNPGAKYLIQVRERLDAGGWRDLQTLTTPANGLLEFTQALGATSSFFRVVAL